MKQGKIIAWRLTIVAMLSIEGAFTEGKSHGRFAVASVR
jgi:hypothetical protein